MNFCSACGAPVELGIPEGEDRERHVCTACGTIHYQNPRVITGCLPVHRDAVLLCRRAIEPRSGYWTLPAGFMELGESAGDGARRETWEEARANVSIEGLYTVFSVPHVSQMYVFYRARLLDLNYAAGPESLEVELFEEADIPWEQLAFPTVRDTLRYYFQDRRNGSFPVRNADILGRRVG